MADERDVNSFLAPEPDRPVSPAAPPTFSVLIPAYNAASTIADALESALSQTVSPKEVVVCDDGSTDDLASAIEPYRNRIVFIRKANGGGASALNAAVAHASAEFVTLLDADDVYLPERIERLGQLAARRPDLDLLSTDAYFEVDGRITGRFNEANPFPTEGQLDAMLSSCYVVTPAVRRRRLLEVGGFDETLATGYDWECWIRLLLSGARVGLVDRPLMRYRLRPGSLTSDKTANLDARVAVLNKAASAGRALSAKERRTLRRARIRYRARARLARLDRAVAEHSPNLRRVAAATVIGRGTPLRARVKAVAALISVDLTKARTVPSERGEQP